MATHTRFGHRLGSVVVALALTTVSLLGPATSAGAAGLTADQAFVTAAYHDFLGRAPTSTELAAATTVSLATPAARANVVGGLSTSTAWIQATVNKLYTDTLGRPGDTGGVAYWVGIIQHHTKTVAQAAAAFYSSDEYFAGFGHSVVQTWVDDLYTKVLLRPGSADPNGVAYWMQMTASEGRGKVAYGFYQSTESRHTRVKALYQTLLGRNPDQAGWDHWAALIATQGDLALAANLASSSEYYNRAQTRYGATNEDGTWTGYIYFPGEPVTSGWKLTFTVTNGQVNDFWGYITGECGMTTEIIYLKGPTPINSGVMAGDAKITPDPTNPGAYVNTYVAGIFDGSTASGTVDYTAVGPCQEPQWNWTATRTG